MNAVTLSTAAILALTAACGQPYVTPMAADYATTHDARVSVTVSLPGCEYEDASGPHDLEPACAWDASTAGNGEGVSFLAVDGGNRTVRYIYADGTVDVAQR